MIYKSVKCFFGVDRWKWVRPNRKNWSGKFEYLKNVFNVYEGPSASCCFWMIQNAVYVDWISVILANYTSLCSFPEKNSQCPHAPQRLFALFCLRVSGLSLRWVLFLCSSWRVLECFPSQVVFPYSFVYVSAYPSILSKGVCFITYVYIYISIVHMCIYIYTWICHMFIYSTHMSNVSM